MIRMFWLTILEKSSMKVRRKVGWISLYLVVIFFAMSSAGWGFLISPSRLDIELSAGEEREFSLYLANPQEKDNIRVKLYSEDFSLRRDGSLEFLRSGSLRWSCAKWIKFEDTEVVLKAGEEKKVYGTIKVPRDASGGRYALVMVELIPGGESKNTGVRSGTRFSILVSALINPNELERSLEIASFEVLDQEERGVTTVSENHKDVRFVVSVENTGNVQVVAKGSVSVRSKVGRVEAIVPLLAGGSHIFPECIRDFKGVMPQPLADGEYTGEAEVRYDEGKSAKAEINFTLKNNCLMKWTLRLIAKNNFA
jgi:hypothetical protein